MGIDVVSLVGNEIGKHGGALAAKTAAFTRSFCEHADPERAAAEADFAFAKHLGRPTHDIARRLEALSGEGLLQKTSGEAPKYADPRIEALRQSIAAHWGSAKDLAETD